MFLNQSHMSPDLSGYIKTILSIAKESLNQQKLERRYIICPLFIAGTAASIASQNRPLTKEYMRSALHLMRAFERESIGTNTASTRKILEDVIEKATRMSGYTELDWISVMDDTGLQIVNFGLWKCMPVHEQALSMPNNAGMRQGERLINRRTEHDIQDGHGWRGIFSLSSSFVKTPCYLRSIPPFNQPFEAHDYFFRLFLSIESLSVAIFLFHVHRSQRRGWGNYGSYFFSCIPHLSTK